MASGQLRTIGQAFGTGGHGAPPRLRHHRDGIDESPSAADAEQDRSRSHSWRLAMAGIVVKTIDGKNTDLSPDALDALRGGLRGALTLPGQPGYDEARTIWNAMIDRRPAAIVRA